MESSHWYPGKNIDKLRRRFKNQVPVHTRAAERLTHSTQNDHSGQPIEKDLDSKEETLQAVLAKHREEEGLLDKMKRTAPRPLMALKRHVTTKRTLNQHTAHAALRSASLRVSLLRGLCLQARRPYVELAVEGFEHRSPTAKGDNPDWTNCVSSDDREKIENDLAVCGVDEDHASYIFNVTDLTGNLTVLLYDDYNLHAGECIGRIIVPIASLLAINGEKSESVERDSDHQDQLSGYSLSFIGSALSGVKDAADQLFSREKGAKCRSKNWYRVFPPASIGRNAQKKSQKGTLPNVENTGTTIDKVKESATKDSSADSECSESRMGETDNESKRKQRESTEGVAVSEMSLVAKVNGKFLNGVPGVPGSAMIRPSRPLGFLELEIELTLHRSVAEAYLMVPPWQVQRQLKERQRGKNDKNTDHDENVEQVIEELDVAVLKRNIYRLRRIFKDPTAGLIFSSPLLFDVVEAGSTKHSFHTSTEKHDTNIKIKVNEGLRENKEVEVQLIKKPAVFWRIFLLLPLLLHSCFSMRLAEVPLWIFFLVVLHGYLVLRLRRRVAYSTAGSVINNVTHGQSQSKNMSLMPVEIENRTMWQPSGIAPSTMPSWVKVFEDELGPSMVPTTPFGKIRALKNQLGQLQVVLGIVSSIFERSANAWNWEDPVVTKLAVLGLGTACIVASLALALLPVRQICFIICAVPLLHPILLPVQASDSMLKATKEDEAARNKKSCTVNISNRIPDAQDVAHRHICSMLPIKEGEMRVQIERRGSVGPHLMSRN